MDSQSVSSQPTTENPVLPPEPWYASPVQRAAVLGILTGMAAVIIDLFGLPVSVQVVNAKIALVGQLASLGFNAWAIIKRQTSPIQPLTFTRAAADAKAGTAQLDPVTLDKTNSFVARQGDAGGSEAKTEGKS